MRANSTNPSKDNLTRRQFISRTASAGVAATVAASAVRAGAQEGSKELLRVGLIGCGGRGAAHLKTLGYLKDNGGNVDVAAVCDVYRPRMDKAAQAWSAKAYMDHRELIADPNVDVVFIASPDHHHGYQALDAVRAGKDVYCEKPVTHWRQFELTRQLAAEVAASDCVFQLGTQGMSDSAWHQMRALIQDGIIGQPIHAECGFFRVGDWGERGMPIDDPNAKPGPDLNWEAFLGDSPERPFDVSRFFRWRMYEDYAGGPTTDLFPHSLTPVIHMLDLGMPCMVVTTGGMFRYTEREVPDTYNVLMDYPEKITVAVLGTQGNDYSGTGSRGSGGRIPIVRGWDGTLTVQGEQIVFIPAAESKGQPKSFPVEAKEDMAQYFDHFLNCCRTRTKDTWSTAQLAYHVQTAMQMATLALRKGAVARFDAGQQKIVV